MSLAPATVSRVPFQVEIYAAVKCAVSVSCLAHAVSSMNILKLPSQNNSLTVTVDILEGKFQAAHTSKITVEPNHSLANMKWKRREIWRGKLPISHSYH